MLVAAHSEARSASDIAATSFLNSFLLEWGAHGLVPDDSAPGFARLSLPSLGATLQLRVRSESRSFYRDFAGPAVLLEDGRAPRALAFPELVWTLMRAAGGEQAVPFLRRALDSHAAIERALRRLPARAQVGDDTDPGFVEAEQALQFGHALHPAPRSRDEFSVEDEERFAPEYGRSFALRWWRVAPDAVSGESEGIALRERLGALAAEDGLADGEGVPVPLHPWQAARLLLDDGVQALFGEGRARDAGPGRGDWRATSSLRTVHGAHSAAMLKFSLTLRLTNSRRIVETRECERGIELHRVLTGRIGRALAERCPTLTILGEPAHVSLRGSDGRPLTATTVVFRDNPFRGQRQGGAAVLAALCETPVGGPSLAARLVHRIAREGGAAPNDVALAWFERYVRTAVEPFLIAQGEFGLLFGAHQQNVVVRLEDGWPVGAWFRDCQGTGYVAEFAEALKPDVPDLSRAAGHVFPSAAAARLVGYYLVINGVLALLAALARDGLASEGELLGILRHRIEAVRDAASRDPTAADYLLRSETLSAKSNFMISLRDLNENTDVTDPLAGYVEVPNPIRGA